LKKRVARKLTKRRREGHQVTMEIPDRFRDGDDAEEDCTALHGTKSYLNQSVFGMIAAAQSQVDFNARFDASSSDEEDESGEPSSQSDSLANFQPEEARTTEPEKQRRKLSENKLLRSIPGLGSKSKSKSPPKSDSPSRGGPPKHSTPEKQVPRKHSHAPVMSRMLEAKAELSMRPSFDMPRFSEDNIQTEDAGERGASTLARKLKEIFQFEEAEDVIEGPLFYSYEKFTHADMIRIPLLAIEERSTARVYVHHEQTYLLLRIFA